RLAVLAGALMSLAACKGEEAAEAPSPADPAVEQTSLHRGCATVEPSVEERAAIDAFLAEQKTAMRAVGSVTVPTYFHVINKGSGLANGDIPDSQITAQMNVLNAAYANTPFRFVLQGTDRTTNSKWFAL
ncbi:zinc metalloprotease, partial [Corallococcus sp. AB038B]